MKKYLIFFFMSFLFGAHAQVFDFDGNLYDTVKIGSQVWLKQNLKSKHYSDGTPISSGIFAYNNDLNNVPLYGYMYSYFAATNNQMVLPVQGVCPNGFHIPDYNEWNTLRSSVGGTMIGANVFSGGDILKDNIAWNGVNTYSFTVLPAGHKNSSGSAGLGTDTWFWSSDGQSNSCTAIFFNNTNNLYTYFMAPTNSDAIYCRCIKNNLQTTLIQNTLLTKIKIYPNPSSTSLHIESDQFFENSEIEITNVLGQTIFKMPFANTINVSTLTNGFYNLKIVSQNKETHTYKFIKN
jgi:uncharacterized protein (TIGR02145 family)